MPKIDIIRLRCLDPKAQKKFYCEVLGMSEREDGAIGYGDQEAGLLFETAASPYRPSANDLYWKIALAVPNLDLACQQLTEKGVEVTPPRQFQEVGYLAHFQDPEGFSIELIDHWFKGDRPADDVDMQRLGGGSHLNLLTLRTADIARVKRSCIAMGMAPLSIQPVPDYGFTLHFYAFTSERPPNADLHAVENRTWVYRRAYTVLEIQHVYRAAEMTGPKTNEGGYGEVVISGLDGSYRAKRLRLRGAETP